MGGGMSAAKGTTRRAGMCGNTPCCQECASRRKRMKYERLKLKSLLAVRQPGPCRGATARVCLPRLPACSSTERVTPPALQRLRPARPRGFCRLQGPDSAACMSANASPERGNGGRGCVPRALLPARPANQLQITRHHTPLRAGRPACGLTLAVHDKAGGLGAAWRRHHNRVFLLQQTGGWGVGVGGWGCKHRGGLRHFET